MNPQRVVQTLAWICAVLILAVGIYLGTHRPRREYPFANQIQKAGEISLSQNGRGIDLLRQGKQWAVSAGNGLHFPADPDRVATLTSGLEGVQVEEEISNRADRAADFEVSPESGLQVRLLGEGKKILAEGIFGKQAPDYSHIYFRFPAKASVYLARGIIRGELGSVDLHDWRSKEIVNIPEAQVRRIVIEGPGFKTDLARSSETWTLEGKSIDSAPVYSLIGALAHLKADDFVDSTSTSAPTFEQLNYAKIHVEGIQAVELRIGAQDMLKRRYPVAAGPDTMAWIADAKINPLLMKPSAFHPK